MKRMLREPLLHFLLLALLLMLGRGAWEPALQRLAGSERIEIRDTDLQRLRGEWLRETGRAPDAAQMAAMVRREIQQEVLFREALRLDLHRQDPVVHARLLRNMQFVQQQETGDAQALVQAAMALGMHEHDLVVRRRLIQLMQHRIESRVTVTENELHAYLERQQRPASGEQRYRFRHLFFDRGAPAAEAEAARLLPRLSQNAIPAQGIGDAFALGSQFGFLTLAEIEHRFGEELATQVARATPGQWAGPVESVYGFHLIRVEAVEARQPPGPGQLRARATASLFAERERIALQDALARMQLRYRIEVAQLPDGDAS